MMNHKDCMKALARHVTDRDIVLPVYSSAFEWLEARKSPLNYTAHGAMGLASSHGLGLALGRPDRRGEIRAEIEPPRLHVVGDQPIESRFEDRHVAGLDLGDLGRVLVDAHHVMAELREAGAGNQSDVARADHGDTHAASP